MQSSDNIAEIRSRIRKAVAEEDAATAVMEIRSLLAHDPKPHEIAFCASSIARLAPQMTRQTGARQIRTFVVRSVTVEPFVPHLMVEGALAGFVLDLKIGGFGSFADDLLNSEGELARFQPDMVLVLLDLEDVAGALPALCATGTGVGVEEEIQEAVARLSMLLQSFRRGNPAKLMLQGMVIPEVSSLGDVADSRIATSLPNAVAELNRRLAALCGGISDCLYFDVDRVAARHGRASWRDERLFLSSRLPISSAAFASYTRALLRSMSAMYVAPKKVLCTDLDNTLWGGVLGEEGVDGIATGTAFPGVCYLRYQQYLKQLSSRGILLAAVSKNNEADVREAFEARAADLALTLDDFVALKISWNDKQQSLRELAEELSLGLDSFVFVDDNPVECEAIRQALPEVTVISAPVEEPWRMVEILATRSLFDTISVTSDDRNRLQEYKAQTQREQLASSTASREEFLGSLGIVCTFSSALEAPLSRAVQLLGKTNQFNLTTRRHSAAEVERFASEPGGQAIVVRVRDRFGDSGVVGLALAKTTGQVCLIDSFLLSCRVIGRGIETALLAQIAKVAQSDGAGQMVGEFLPSKKNSLCADFYPKHGFLPLEGDKTDSSTSIFYELDLNAAPPATPDWITIEDNTQNELRASNLIAT